MGDDRPVTLDVVGSYVVEEPATTTDQHQQATPAVMVLLVDLQVLGEVVDALGEECDLDLRRDRQRHRGSERIQKLVPVGERRGVLLVGEREVARPTEREGDVSI